MSKALGSSIGQKFVMSISGLFLIVFLLLHLSINLLLLFSEEAFNEASHFMATNPFIYVMQYILAAGFLFHIIWSSVLTLQNQAARPVHYEKKDRGKVSSWSSRNMYILGALILTFLVIHIMNYFYVIKFGDMAGQTDYQLVTSKFHIWYYVLIYVLGFIFLGLHLNHSFQSAFQTLGLNNKIWASRIKAVGLIYTLVISIGFLIIPLYFYFLN